MIGSIRIDGQSVFSNFPIIHRGDVEDAEKADSFIVVSSFVFS